MPISFGDVITVKFTRSSILQELRECEYGSYEDHIRLQNCANCNGEGNFEVVPFGSDESVQSELVECRICKGAGRVEHREPPYDKGRKHIVELIDRSLNAKNKTRVYLHSNEEVEEFFVQTCTGTFGLYHLRQAGRIYDLLYPFVDTKIRNRISRGSLGY